MARKARRTVFSRSTSGKSAGAGKGFVKFDRLQALSHSWRALLGCAAICGFGAFSFGISNHLEGAAFLTCIWLLPIIAAFTFYRERQQHPLWKEKLTWTSKRSLAYLIAIGSQLFLPYMSVLPYGTERNVFHALSTPLFLTAAFGAVLIVLFLLDGDQPTVKEGKLVPMLLSFISFVLVITL